MTEQHLEEKLRQACHEAMGLGFNRPNRFLQMLETHGAIETVRRLLPANNFPEGLTRLWEVGTTNGNLQQMLNLSMEAIILQQPYCQLFSPEYLQIARLRLTQLAYQF